MQEVHFRLFKVNRAEELKAKQRTTLMAVLLLLLQLGLFAYLVITKGFTYSFLGLYLLHLVVFLLLLVRIWFYRHPEFRGHVTVTDQGVRYCTGLFKKEQEFDWAEVDVMRLEPTNVLFILKNEEQHQVRLAKLRDEAALKKAKQKLEAIAYQKNIPITRSAL